jgi:hypothetical protein
MRIVAYIGGCLLLGAVVIGLVPAVSVAQGPGAAPSEGAGSAEADKKLAEIEEQILYARYGEARDPLKAMTEDATLSARQRVRALELMAILQIATGDDAGSRATLKDLCSRDPDHRVDDPDISPKVAAAFTKACKAVISHVNVQMENIVPTRELLRQQPVVKVRVIKYLDAVDVIQVHFKQGDQSEFEKVSIVPDAKGIAQAPIPPLANQGEYDINFFVEALAPSGARIGRMGSAETPLRVTVPAAKSCTDPKDAACRCEFFPKTPGCPYCFEHPEEAECSNDPCVRDAGSLECTCSQDPAAEGCEERRESGSVFGKWWFWTIAGAVLVGGAVAGVILLSPTDDPLEGSLGSAGLK